MSTFQHILTEIIEKIEIDKNFAVRHPDYPPLELRPDIIAKFQQKSLDLQEKYLIIQVQNYLYDIYFSHSLWSLQEIAAKAEQSTQIKNNVVNGIDINFYQQLKQNNTSTGYIDSDWQIVAETDSGELIVLKDELHLHIERQKHLPIYLQQATIGDVVAIYLPHNLVSQDSYIMVGNFGTPDRSQSVEIYFNFTPDAAISIAQKLTHELNKLGIPFQFAILHNPALFYCYDAGTLWLPQAGYLAAQKVLAEIYQLHQAEFSDNIPLFSKQLAPGLGIAEVPTTPDPFGMQRCELLATGLVAAMEQDLVADKFNTVCQEFTTAGIDWLQPYLNPSGLDCYQKIVF
jgi:hypothetical protein